MDKEPQSLAEQRGWHIADRTEEAYLKLRRHIHVLGQREGDQSEDFISYECECQDSIAVRPSETRCKFVQRVIAESVESSEQGGPSITGAIKTLTHLCGTDAVEAALERIRSEFH